MKRSGFPRAVYERPARVLPVPVPGLFRLGEVSEARSPLPKDARDMQPGDQDRLWGHVRALPCARCWREGMTEVSHSNQLQDGKGRSLKAYPWRVAALCHECHAFIDQGKGLGKVERIEAWDTAHRVTLGWLFRDGKVRPV